MKNPRNNKNIWKEICHWCNFFYGREIGRLDMIYAVQQSVISSCPTTIDNYRNWLTKAGYLEIIGRGKYRVVNLIPPTLSVLECRREAYENI